MGTILLITLGCLLLGAVVALWTMVGREKRAHQGSCEKLETIQEELKTTKEQLHESQQQHLQCEGERRTTEALYQNLMSQQKQSLEEQQRREEQLTAQFKLLAGDIFTNHTQQLKANNKESIETLLKPFKENITSFKERMETIYSFENEQRGALRNELERLMELNRRITTETTNLTNALRGNSKVQGDWGEMILETILQSSNLTKGTHYTTQHNFKDEAGNNLRPDVVLNLPEGKQIIIDSKTSLTAFVNYVGCEDAAERRQLLDAHIVSVRQHIKELSNKDYQKFVNSPDFVIMFIPSEPAFLAALQADSTLWSEAYERRVIISSPTNLFALLKLVDDLWKRNAQSKNTADIVRRGTKLYEQLVNFVGALEGVGTALDVAQSKYGEAYKRLCTGNDNIIRTGERLRALGIPTKKRQSIKAMVDNETDEEESESLLPPPTIDLE
ncbi:MAG: DNA recombination protein RmuC [Rikenellaceae bacterium]